MEFLFVKPSLDILYDTTKLKTSKEVKAYILENNLLDLYRKCVEDKTFKFSKKEESSIIKNIANNIKKIEEKYSETKEEENDKLEEKKIEISKMYAECLDYDGFTKSLNDLQKTKFVTVDALLCKIRFCFILKRHKILDDLFEEVRLVIKICDWDRKNKLKTYYALYLLNKGAVKESAYIFSDCLSTFNSDELFSFEKASLYAIFTGLITFSRINFENVIFKNSDILEIKNKIPDNINMMSTYVKGDYNFFFQNLVNFTEKNIDDPFLKNRMNFFIKKIKSKIYKQIFDSYLNIKISKISEMFRISEKYIERDIRDLIFTMNLGCKIDGIENKIVVFQKQKDYFSKLNNLKSKYEEVIIKKK